MKMRLLASGVLWLMIMPSVAQQVDDVVGVSLAGPGNHPGPSLLAFGTSPAAETITTDVGTALVIDFGWDGREIHDVRVRLIARLEQRLNEGDRTIVNSFVATQTMLETMIAAKDQTRSRLGGDVGFSVTEGVGLGFSYETLVGFDNDDEHSIIGRAVLRF